jgi:hypothetical protein
VPRFVRNRRTWRGRLQIADGERADALRGGEVALEQQRRDAEHVRVVVEARARVVRRQHRRDVDLEREEIAHGIRVFGAVQAMDERTPRIRCAGRGAVERRLQRGDERGAHARLGARDSGGRHHAGADSPRDFFPDVRIERAGREVFGIEDQAAGLHPLVVAGDAVGGNRLTVLGDWRRRGCRRLLRGGEW